MNEICGLVLKAGRGAGLPLGVAEDVSAAAAYMDKTALADLLEMFQAAEQRLVLSEICTALDARACGQDPELPFCGAVGPAMEAVSQSAPVQSGQRDVPDVVWSGLEVFAQATYVPATEASREAGAGAGLDDND